MSSPDGFGRRRMAFPPAVALAFVVAPLVMLVTLLVHNGGVQHIHTEQFGSQIQAASAHHARYYVGHVGFVAGFVLLVPGLLVLARELAAAGRETRVRLGVACVVVGLIGGSLSLGIDLAVYQLTSPGPGRAAAVRALADTNFAPEVLGPIAVLGLGLGVGLTLLVIEAVRVGLIPRWSAGAIALGAFGAGLLFNTDLAVPTAVIFALGLGRMALGWPRAGVVSRGVGVSVLVVVAAMFAPGVAGAHEDHPGAVAEAAADGEISLNVSGKPFRGATSYGQVRGLLDGHSHMMIDRGFGENGACGRAWSPQGPSVALQDCPQHKDGGGSGAYLYNILESGVSGNPTATHDSAGWPTFSGWPAWNVVMHQQVYYRWLERAWRAGLRTYTMLATDLASACELNSYRTASCDETDSTRRQIQATYALQRYIDERSGGPGKGFFRIVRDPFEARRVINQGKLAVVLGVEVSELFGCGQRRGVPQCGRAQIDGGLDEMKRLGVSRVFVSHKFDNALAGVAMDKEAAGALINSLQYQHTGRFWDIETCTGPAQDEYQIPLATNPFGDLITGGPAALAPPGQLPAYPPRPHCNKMGLTQLGDYFVRALIRRRMIVEVDHMSVRAREQTLNLLEARRYSGVISSHSWSDEQSLPRILDLGGVITPMAGPANLPLACCYLDVWKRLRASAGAKPGQTLPIGFGDDMSSPAPQPPPRQAGEPTVRYPFRSFDGGTLVDRQRSGTRTFDINTDGVAHFGLFPDWWERLRLTAGARITRDLAAGSEAYLDMWERAEGVPGPRCRYVRGHFKRRGLSWMRLGFTPRQLLVHAGQPLSRFRAWRYCAKAHRKPKGTVTAVFTRRARVGLVLSSARGHEASGIAPGVKARRLSGHARRLGRGLWVRRTSRGVRYVYVVRRGRVRYVGTASGSVARSSKRLRAYLRLARRRGA